MNYSGARNLREQPAASSQRLKAAGSWEDHNVHYGRSFSSSLMCTTILNEAFRNTSPRKHHMRHCYSHTLTPHTPHFTPAVSPPRRRYRANTTASQFRLKF
ncbi:hypothetical protein E2C01_009046 [Portunus trituberculatus]|uniref:Uncharacterized protein n=1 Tax=Portunus trituberculatus TaxID=210409 RepID=A0A5B7D594_PORTR|nr:hypothetical protein [Portunus trituberculatus]